MEWSDTLSEMTAAEMQQLCVFMLKHTARSRLLRHHHKLLWIWTDARALWALWHEFLNRQQTSNKYEWNGMHRISAYNIYIEVTRSMRKITGVAVVAWLWRLSKQKSEYPWTTGRERHSKLWAHTFTNFSHTFVVSVQENLLQWCAAGRMDKSAAGLLCDPICTVCSAESWDFHNELRGNNRRQNPLVLVFIILKSKINAFKVFSIPNNCRIVYYIQPFTNEPQLLAKHKTEHGIFLQFLGHWTEIQEVPLIWGESLAKSKWNWFYWLISSQINIHQTD